MANELVAADSTARADPRAAAVAEDDYRAFCAALSDSERGRAFLTEYARRNRHADTEMLLAALDRLEAQMRRHAAAPEADRIRQELRALLAAIQTTQPEIGDGPAAIRAAKLAALLGFVEHRIEVIVAPAREQSILPDEVAALVMPERAAEAARSALAVVPMPEQPELPIPAPDSQQPPELTLVRAAPAIPEVVFIASEPLKTAAAEPIEIETIEAEVIAVEAKVDTKAIEIAVAELSAPMPPAIDEPAPAQMTVPHADPLAAIMALSDVERLALFT